MNKNICLILLLLSQCYLFSFDPSPFRLDLYSGYRVDEFEVRLLSDTNEEILMFSEKYKHPRYIQTGASFSILNNGFYLLADCGYAPLLNHKMWMIDTDTDNNEYYFDYKIKGYDLNGALELGITANLTPERMYKFYVIPLAGYSGFWKFYKINDPHPSPYIDFTNNLKVEGYSVLNLRKFREVWYGPYIGAKLYIVPNNFVSFDLAYHFNWVKLKLRFASLLDILKYDNNADLFLHEVISKDFDDTASDGYSHQAFAKITFNSSRHIKLGFFARYNYLMNDKKKGRVTINSDRLFPDNKQNQFKSVNKVFSRWWNLTGAFELIFQF
jgi:hypothetical protein